jgi:hypothetical protein
MSYYETYEFFAIDRRLTHAEMRALRRISTRATITPTRFHNFYNWGGLKADPQDEWTQVARLVEEKKARGYDDAVQRLLALRELSVDRGTENEFAARLDGLLAQHRSKHAFLSRVRGRITPLIP